MQKNDLVKEITEAIAELNEHYKEKDMKEDRYEFDFREWEWELERGVSDKLTVTRKKPKVKVEYEGVHVTLPVLGKQNSSGFYIVQFRVTGSLNSEYVYSYQDKGLMSILTPHCTVSSFNLREPVNSMDVLHIATDARSKWSTPVLLPEEVYSKLPEIVKALEEKANG